MNALRSCVAALTASLFLAAPAAAQSTQCPSKSTGPHPDAQRAGQIFTGWHVELPPSIGDQYAGHGVDNTRGTWFVGYAPGPLDEAAVRSRLFEVVDRHASPEDAAWMREHLTLDPQPYSERELRDIQARLTDTAADGRFGPAWGLGVGCMHGDVRRVELELYSERTTAAQHEEARRAAAEFGDRALAVVVPGQGPSPGSLATCPLVTPAPPPVEGGRGFVFVEQFCRAGERVEDFDVVTDFGDGTRASTPFRADGLWMAGGDHAYRRAGRYKVRTAITDRRTGVTSYLLQTVQIRNAPLTRRSIPRPAFRPGRSARRVVAAFADGNPLARARDHRATVRWGDGTRSRAQVRRTAAGRFEVLGRHRYAAGEALPRRITVRVDDGRGASLRIRTPLARAGG